MPRAKQKLSFNDSPNLNDFLNQSSFVENLCEVIVDCDPPKGIGVNGYWGTGKTTILLNLYFQFSGKHPFDEKVKGTAKFKDKKVIPIWFEAWRYQHEALPIVALLNEIRSQVNTWNSLRRKTEKIIGVSLLGALSAFDEVIKVASGGVIKPELGKIKDIGENWEKERYLNQLPSQTIHHLLEEAIQQLAGKEHRLVIFIDDLDRCSPDKALQLMEGIKVYLNLSNCVTVFGMDQRQVEHALKTAYKDYFVPQQAKEYLEKICQDIYHIPVPDQAAKTKYLMDLLVRLKLKLEYNSAEQKTHRIQIKNVLNEYDCLPANPRKIKALANRIGVMLRYCDFNNTDTITKTDKYIIKTDIRRDYAIMMMLVILHTFHRQVYEQLQKNYGYINTIMEYGKANGLGGKGLPEKYSPMKDIVPLITEDLTVLPQNPSDSNVFRLHDLIQGLGAVKSNEIKDMLNKGI